MSTIPLRNGEYTVQAFDVNLTGSSFEDALLVNAAFKYTSFEKSEFTLVRFDNAVMSNVSFEGATLERVSFVNTAIKHGRYAGMTIDGISVEKLLKNYHAFTADAAPTSAES